MDIQVAQAQAAAIASAMSDASDRIAEASVWGAVYVAMLDGNPSNEDAAGAVADHAVPRWAKRSR